MRLIRRYQGGMTLLELLVALGVFAIAAVAILDTIGATSRQVSHLEQRTLAHWVASNKLAQLRMQSDWPSLGVKRDQMRLADRDWYISFEVQATARKDMRRLIVSVRDDQDGPVLAQRDWFFGALQ